jgi:hypothetical protein
MFNKEKLQALTNNCKKNDRYLMGFGMGFWKRSKLGFVLIFKSCFFWWTIQDYRPFRFGAGSSCFKSSSSRLSHEGPTNWSLVFLNFLTLWLLFPPLKLK